VGPTHGLQTKPRRTPTTNCSAALVSDKATDDTVPGTAETASRDAETSRDGRAEKDETQQHQKNRGDCPEQIAVETDRKTDRRDKKTGSRERRRNTSREPIGARSVRRRRGAYDEWKERKDAGRERRQNAC
jgi:hypothetical protein